jgi:hydrogenase-4 component B
MLGLAGCCVVIRFPDAVLAGSGARNRGVASRVGFGGNTRAVVHTGSVHVALAILVLGAVAWLWRKAHANGLRRGPTWDCGYAAPTARMQYTGGSFAGIAAGWFAWVLRPERKMRRPRGHFPAEALRLERVPETVLERIIAPVGVRIMQVSTAVRRLQHGRLQFYILYVVAGLIALGVLVLLGGAP